MNWTEEIYHDIISIHPVKKELKKFGILIGLIFIGGASVAYMRLWWNLPIALIVFSVGAVLVLLGVFAPARLHKLYRGWMTIAVILGSIVSRIILVVLFYIVVVPIGILIKIFGKKFFIPYNRTEHHSYWILRDRSKNINYERMS
jgi:hypothetical protein